MIQEISALKNAGTSLLNLAWCMSKCQVKAGYATIVIKFSFLQYPLKSWSPLDLRSLHEHDSAPKALKQLIPLSRLTLLPLPLHHLYYWYSWRSCLYWVDRESWRGGDANKPTPFSSTSGLTDHGARSQSMGMELAYSFYSFQYWSQSPLLGAAYKFTSYQRITELFGLEETLKVV